MAKKQKIETIKGVPLPHDISRSTWVVYVTSSPDPESPAIFIDSFGLEEDAVKLAQVKLENRSALVAYVIRRDVIEGKRFMHHIETRKELVSIK